MTLEELRKHRDTLRQRRADLAAAEAALPRLEARAAAADQARGAAVAALETARTRLAECIAARDGLATARAEAEAAENAVAALENQLAELRRQGAELRRDAARASRLNLPNLAELEAQLEELEAQVSARQAQRDSARAQAETTRARVGALATRADEVPAAEAGLREAATVAAPLVERADALEAERTTLRTTVQTLHGQVERLAADYQRHLDALIGALDTKVPLALLPIRLETRFEDRRGGGADLLVRIYPDDIHQDAHDRELSGDEIAWGQKFWERRQEAADDEALRRQAWNQLAGRFGPARATWIARETEPTRTPQPRERPPRGAHTRVLPDRWVAFGYEAGKRVFTVWGELIPHPLPTAPVPSATPGSLNESVRWMVDFDRAVQEGMGLRIPQAPDTIDLLLVLGVKATLDAQASQQELHSLLEAHHHTWGLAFVPQGTPTNNSAEAPSGYTARDAGYETSFALLSAGTLFLTGDGSDGDLATRALGLAPPHGEPLVLAYAPRANGWDQKGAEEINTAFWPATWGYFLRQMMADAFLDSDLVQWRDFFIRHVRARGPLPAIRVGNQPYGLLPVTSLDLWQPEELRPDLLLFHIANPAGENEGFYHIGWDMVMHEGRYQGPSDWSEPASVPGWFGWENQGAGIAIADIRGSRHLDLVVAHIDNPAHDNRGYYRVGWDLDAHGTARGGWTDPIPIPGWFGWESQGAGVAVADLSGSGHPDLVVFHIDNAVGANRGYYRVGWELDSQGVAARWSDPIPLPDPFADETRTGGIAIADVNGNGRPDLIVFWLNQVPGVSTGYYRIGWDLDENGQATGGWSTAVRVPDMLGDDNRGADIAVADLTSNGRLDLVLFYLVGSGGTPYGYLQVGYGLDALGQVTEGWSGNFPTPAPHRGAAQGAGVAVADIGRSRPITPRFESRDLVNLLTSFRENWRSARAGRHVPHAGRPGSDPDEELVRMLGMEALSSQYRGRSSLGPDYTRALWSFLENPWFSDPTLATGEGSWWEQHRKMAEAALQALRLELPHEPRLLQASFAADAFVVKGPLVHDGPPSESDPLPDPANYIRWLSERSPQEIHAQAGLPDKVARTALLYRLLRHATLWAYADAALRLRPRVPDDLVEARRQEREPELVDLDDPRAPDPSVIHSWTPWRHLVEQTLDGRSLAEILHQDPARDRLLADFLRGLEWLSSQPTAALERLCAESLDLGSHRLDAWITASATHRLWRMRQAPSPGQPPVTGLQLGGYGWVEKLQRKPQGAAASAGYIQAPSLAHATTAAILRSGYLSHQGSSTGDLLALDLSSERVRLALSLLDGLRQGQPLGALLGYRFERMLHDLQLDKYIATFREFYPLTARKLVPATEPVEAIAAHGVVDGYKLLEQWQKGKVPFGESRTDTLMPLPSGGEEYVKLQQALEALGQVADAASDAVTAESVYQVVQGNPLRAGASLDAIARGEAPVPELEVARSARSGIALTHRIVALFSGEAATTVAWPTNRWQARAGAEPHLNAWAGRLLPPPSKVRYWAEYLDRQSGTLLQTRDDLSLQDLELSPLDILYTALPGEVTLEELDPTMSAPQETPPGDEMQRSELAQRMVYHLLRGPPNGVPTDARVRLHFTRRPGWSTEELTLPEFLEIVRAARDLLTGGRALGAPDLAPPAQGAVEPSIDAEELKNRADTAQSRLRKGRDALIALLDEARLQLAVLPETSSEMRQDLRRVPAALWEQVVFSEEQWATAHESLLQLAYLGLDGAIPVSAASVPDTAASVRLLQQLVTIVIEANRRLDSLAGTSDLACLQEIFGRGFRVLPRFTPPNKEALQEAFSGSASSQGATPQAVAPWFQRVARLRDGAARLDAALLYAEATSAGDTLDFRVAQLPYHASDRWVALPLVPGASLPGGRLSLVAHTPAGLNLESSSGDPVALAGLLVDEWVEVVPNPTETTAVAFHYDAPGARAPQAVLLAVPPDPRRGWSLASLEAVLLETLDLAKLRAVDPDALEQVGHFLPALYFAFNVSGDTIATDFTAP